MNDVFLEALPRLAEPGESSQARNVFACDALWATPEARVEHHALFRELFMPEGGNETQPWFDFEGELGASRQSELGYTEKIIALTLAHEVAKSIIEEAMPTLT